MQLLCGVLSEVNIIHINGFVIGTAETDRFIIAAVARNVMVKVVSAYLLNFRILEVYSVAIKFISQMKFGIPVIAWHNYFCSYFYVNQSKASKLS